MLMVLLALVTLSESSSGQDAPTATTAPVSPAIAEGPKDTKPTPKEAQDPPAPPLKYLETGARMFNSGNYSLAWKYLEAAQRYRSRLTSHEQVVLDLYREEYDKYCRDLRDKRSPTPSAGEKQAQAGSKTDDHIMTTSTVGVPILTLGDQTSSPAKPPASTNPPEPGPGAAAPSLLSSFAPSPVTSGPDSHGIGESPVRQTQTWRAPAEPKQRARWLLQRARENMVRKDYNAAAAYITEAKAIPVKWSVFDETPERVAEALAKARVKAGLAASPEQPQPRDRRAARLKLREARTALAAKELDKAEAIVNEVKSWNLHFGLFDDTPDKVNLAVAEVRRRETVAKMDVMVQSYLGGKTASPDPGATQPADAQAVPLETPP
jgi:hypothetical protein